jgi:hypothetical protein
MYINILSIKSIEQMVPNMLNTESWKVSIKVCEFLNFDIFF